MNDNNFAYEIAPIRGASAHNEKVMTVKGNKNETDMAAFKAAQRRMDARYGIVSKQSRKLSEAEKEKQAVSLEFAKAFIKENFGGDLVSYYQKNFAKTPVDKPRIYIAKLHWKFVMTNIYEERLLQTVLTNIIEQGERLKIEKVEDELDRLMFSKLF